MEREALALNGDEQKEMDATHLNVPDCGEGFAFNLVIPVIEAAKEVFERNPNLHQGGK